jgi:hypothetical protein
MKTLTALCFCLISAMVVAQTTSERLALTPVKKDRNRKK